MQQATSITTPPAPPSTDVIARHPSQSPECRECVAGDAVLIAPVSAAIPCKQGILQGKPGFWSFGTIRAALNSPLFQQFATISLLKLTGKTIEQSG
jgi:hypothetical protein